MFHVIAVNDFASASMAAFGVIAALNARERTGEGQVMETSLTAQSAMFQSGELTTWPGAPAAPKGCRDCLGIAALDRFYACADGWIAVACAGVDEARALAAALGHPDWADRFDMLAEPRDGALAGELAAALAAHTDGRGAGRAAGRRRARLPGARGRGDPLRPVAVGQRLLRPAAPDAARPGGQPALRHVSRAARAATAAPTPASASTPSRCWPTTASTEDRIAQLADDGVVLCLS